MSEHIGHFSLWGNFKVEEVTQLLGMQPSQVFRKGEVLDGASGPATVSTWDLHCPPETGTSMAEQIGILLDILSPKADVLRLLAARFQAELNVATSCTDGPSVLNLNHELLQKLVALNLEVNCFYICDKEADDMSILARELSLGDVPAENVGESAQDS